MSTIIRRTDERHRLIILLSWDASDDVWMQLNLTNCPSSEALQCDRLQHGLRISQHKHCHQSQLAPIRKRDLHATGGGRQPCDDGKAKA